MKRLTILFSGIVMALPFEFVSAQKTIAQDIPSAITAIDKEYISSFGLQRNIDLNFAKFKRDGDETGTQNSFGFNADYNYYPKSKWGFGTTILWNQSTTEFNTTKTTSTDFGAFANISYIEVLNPQTALYGRIGVGYLSDITKITSGSNSTKETNDGFALRGTVGLPLHLGGMLHATPYVQYQYQSGNIEGGKFTDNTISAGVNLEAYLRCHEDYSCDSKVGYKHSEHAYDPGKNFFGFWTNANFSSGTTKTKYDDPAEETTDKHSTVDLSVDYTRYVWKGIGLGAKIKIQNNVQESEDFNFKFTETVLEFSPHVVLQGPWEGAARNLFLDVEGIFGTQTFKTTVGSNSTTFKDKISGFGIGFGYNCFFTDNIAISPIICRDWITLKDDETGDKQNKNEWGFGVGLRANF